MAGKYGSASGWIYVDGYNLSPVKLKNLGVKIEAAQEASHGVGDSWEESTPIGLSKATLTADGGFFDTTSGSAWDSLGGTSAGKVPTTPQSTRRVVCAGFGGNAAGRPFYGFEGTYEQAFEVIASRGELTKANAAFTISGAADEGVVIHPLGAETGDPGTNLSEVDWTGRTGDGATTGAEGRTTFSIQTASVANPTVVTTYGAHGLTSGDVVYISGSNSTPTIDGERTVTVTSTTTFTVPVTVTVQGTAGTYTVGETNAGGVGYLQVTALTLGGFNHLTVTVRDSSDGTTYADLMDFTDVAAIGAERKTVAGEVQRYMAVSHDFDGTGSGQSATYFVGFKRN